MLIQRHIEKTIQKSLEQFPAVALLGPRQIGKTTLAKAVATKLTEKASLYIDLELPSDRARLSDPELYLRGEAGKLIILDEIQRLPEIFATLRALIDERRAKGEHAGQFLLLGSASLDLIRQSSETLAGRIAYSELTGFTIQEIEGAVQGGEGGTEQLWLRGGFPDSFLAPDDTASFAWREAFIRTYLERDIPSLGPRIPAETMRRFWGMLAHNQAALLNASRMAAGLGVSGQTIMRYLDLLVDLLIARALRPYSGNAGKRLVKSPKTYLRDSGLVHALLGLPSRDALLSHPVSGGSWEGFIIEQILASVPGFQPSFYRSAAGAEIDLVLERGDSRIAIEIKRTSAPSVSQGFRFACEDIAATHRMVVHAGDHSFSLDPQTRALPLPACLETLAHIL